jgi:hypothetical protein
LLQLTLGCLAIALPGAYDIPTYASALTQLPRYAVVFVAGGVLMLLSSVAKIHWPGPVPVILAVLGGLPVVGLSVVVLFRSGLWAAPILGFVLAVGVLVDAVRGSPAVKTRWTTVPSIAVAAAVGAGAYGVLGLIAPHTVPVAPRSWLAAIHLPLSIAMLAAPVLLILGWVFPRIRAATQTAAAIPLGVLAVGLALTGRWPGVMIYGVPAAFLAAEPLLQRMMERRVAERHAAPHIVARFEVATEATAWGFVVMLALAGTLAQPVEERLALAVLVLLTSAFTISWYHLRSLSGSRMQQTVIGVAVYSFLGALLVQVTGGTRSPYFFVYTLPIIALAWTRAPQTIVVPLAIPLAAMLTEVTIGLRAGGAQIGALPGSCSSLDFPTCWPAATSTSSTGYARRTCGCRRSWTTWPKGWWLSTPRAVSR